MPSLRWERSHSRGSPILRSVALRDALRETLGSLGCAVDAEAVLENDRRADVLVRFPDGGPRAAFEVQFADLSPAALRERRAAYAGVGVTDYWILGLPRKSRADGLAQALAASEGQRLLYAGPTHDDKGRPSPVVCEEPVLGLFLGEPLRPGAILGRPLRNFRILRNVRYRPSALRLGEDGSLRTPADHEYERLVGSFRARRQSGSSGSRSPETHQRNSPRRRTRRASPPADGVPLELAEPYMRESLRRAEAAEPAWRASTRREMAVDELGEALVALLDERRPHDSGVPVPPGLWKTELLLRITRSCQARRVRYFNWAPIAEGVLDEYLGTMRKGLVLEARLAVRDLRTLLLSEGVLVSATAGPHETMRLGVPGRRP